MSCPLADGTLWPARDSATTPQSLTQLDDTPQALHDTLRDIENTLWPAGRQAGRQPQQGRSQSESTLRPGARDQAAEKAPNSSHGDGAAWFALGGQFGGMPQRSPQDAGTLLPAGGEAGVGRLRNVVLSDAPPAPAPAISDDNNFWMMNLRGSPNDGEATDDPLVFGPPRPKPPKRRRSKPPKEAPKGSKEAPFAGPEPVPSSPVEQESEETAAWMCDLRGSQGEDADLPAGVFGKPRSQPLQRRAPRTKPPRPDAATPESGDPCAQASGASNGASGGSRPSSGGYFSKPTAKARQYMPEAARGGCGAEPRDRGRPPPQPAFSDESRCDSDLRLPPINRAPSANCKDAGPARGRRASSQPPVEANDSGSRRSSKKQSQAKRPQSVSAGQAGGDDEEKCGRQMFDKNTLRTMNRDLFMSAIKVFRQERGLRDGVNDMVQPTDGLPVQKKGVKVFLRKRPIFEKEEKQRGDFDVTSTMRDNPSMVLVHNCMFQADLKTPYISHLSYEFDSIFHERAENNEVYKVSASELVRSAVDGGVSTMFMFGQTGSGKTYTMSAIQEFAAQDLFQGADRQEPWLSVQFVELRGNRCFDLLAPSADARKNSRPELRLRDQGDGSFAAEGAVDMFPKTPEELCAMMQMAQSRRATSATDANSVSSRSHAVCTLRLFQSDGQLMLVDCAGTERRKDSMYHSKERQQEGAEINASLHALKECVRLLGTQQKVPSHAYRASSLTKILADAFTRNSSEVRLAVICTASPCATDTEHTVATLRMGMALGGRGNEHEEKQLLSDLLRERKAPRLTHPKSWSPEQVYEWVDRLCDGSFEDIAGQLPSNFTGQMLVRLSEGRCVQLCGGNEKRGRQFFDLLHQEIHRVDASRKGR